MKIIWCYFLIFLICSSNSQPSKEEILEALNRNKQNKKNSKLPNLLIFTFKKERKNDIPMFARILTEFLSTIGVTANFGEPQDNEIVATIPRGQTVDKKVIMDNFKEVLENVDIADFTKG